MKFHGWLQLGVRHAYFETICRSCCTIFPTLPKTNYNFKVTNIVSSPNSLSLDQSDIVICANALNLDQSDIVSFVQMLSIWTSLILCHLCKCSQFGPV